MTFPAHPITHMLPILDGARFTQTNGEVHLSLDQSLAFVRWVDQSRKRRLPSPPLLCRAQDAVYGKLISPRTIYVFTPIIP